MIALVPTDADLDRLAADGGEPRDELHLTLYYLGDAVDVDIDIRQAMINSVTSMVESRDESAVRARAFGVAHWNPMGEDPAWVLNVGDIADDDGETIGYIRGMITESLYDSVIEFIMPQQHTPWQPHICVAYSDDEDWYNRGLLMLGDVTFDRIRFAFGGEVTDVPLGMTATVASTSGGTIVPWHTVHNHAECPDGKPWAVVKDADGSVAGCHASQADADQQLAALYASENDTAIVAPLAAAIKPAKSTDNGDECPPGNRKLPDGSCLSEDEYATESAWEGVLVVEGITTGDGREFAPNALSWAEHALLRWQKEGSHGGEHDVTVSVGRIDEVWRDGSTVYGRGQLNLESVDGFEVYKRMKNDFAGGISIDADDIQDADVEFVWPESPEDGETAETDDDLIISMLFGRPEKMIFHGGRVRAATIVDIPAFVEAYIGLSSKVETVAASASDVFDGKVVLAHETPTSDEPWDRAVTARRLPNIMNVELARQAYAWVGDSAARVGKTECGYLHHEVDSTGEVGAANLTACSVAIAALSNDETLLPIERRAIYEHLASHLRAAGQEPTPLPTPEVITASTVAVLDDWRPDAAWFANPRLNVPVGITVTDQGRVYGHAAQWGECHIGYEDLCVTPPHEDAHPYFMTGEMVCVDGSRVSVGQITLGTGHAPLSYRASRAVEHYDNTGSVVADVAVGNDEHGIWVAGAVRANAAASRVHELRASGQVSGDWRRIGNQLRLVGLLAVNVPGFPVPRLRARVAGGAPVALIAAGQTSVGHGVNVTASVEPVDRNRSEEELNRLAMRRVMNVLAQRVKPELQTEGV